jgi:hypothetical protein
MKNLILIALTVLSFNGYSQLVVKETPKDTIIWQQSKLISLPKLMRFSFDTEFSYVIYYKNAKYPSITDIQYITTGDLETTKQFFELCKTVIVDDKEFSIDLDKKSISLQKSLGAVMVYMSSSYFLLTEKQIDLILEKLKLEI